MFVKIVKSQSPGFMFLKNIFILIFLLFSTIASATNYYVSSVGSDAANGLSESTPWKSIAKVNTVFSLFNPGDKILFRRGDTFNGTIMITKSGLAGSPITIGAYGTGEDPVVTGLVTLGSWTNEGNGIYSTSLSGVSRLEIVIVDGKQYWMGQYPNTGNLTYESFNSNLSITDNSLPATPNWTGAELFFRKNYYTTARASITSHSGQTLFYSEIPAASTSSLKNDFGYIIQNDIRTLKDFGDWCFKNSKLYMFFGFDNPANHNVKAATVDDLVYLSGRNYITIENIHLSGCNQKGINAISVKYLIINRCKLDYLGSRGLHIVWDVTSSNITVDNSVFKKINGNAVEIWANDIVFTNNIIDSIGLIRGSCYSSNDGNGIYGKFTNGLIQYNEIGNIAHNGIWPTGSNVKIYNNYIHDVVLQYIDAGAIYLTHDGGLYPGQEIKNNIIIDAIGNNWGTDYEYSPWMYAEGIFLDSYTDNVAVDGNSVANCNVGIKLFEAQGTVVKNNTIYNNAWQIYLSSIEATTPVHPIRNLSLDNNIFFAKEASQLALRFHTVENDLALFGTSDNNFWARPIDDDDVFLTHQPSTGTLYRTLSSWQSFTGQDANSRKSPITISDINDIRFEFNASKLNKVITLTKPMIDIKGTKYQNSITLLPYTSAILMVDPNPPATVGCTNETFTAAAGTVTDNSGSSSYLNNMSCEKLIQPPGAGYITLTFTSFNTEAGYDLVRVYAGSTTSAPLLGTFSGSSLPPVLTSSGGSMLIRFTTDYAGVTSGWSATYTTAASGGCINETFTAAAGTVTDNSGSSSYLNNMSCEKLIQPSGGGTITLTFTSFITEANYDYVRVYDGSTTSAPLLGTFSGSSLPPVLTSSGGSMLIRFTTDYAGVTSGWSATYTTAASGGCINETFTAAAGTVTDNSGSSSYLNNMSCEKLIQPSGGGTITLTFTSFITEANYDYVRVYDGSTTSAPLLGTFSGSSLPPVLTSSGGSMLIRFTTDYAGVTSGWSATYTTAASGGCINETFTAAAGTVTDNSGSSSYLNNMSCEKLIQPSGGGTITLTFTSFITEANYDYVRVYDGSTTSAPLLGTFSGSSLPPVLTSSGGSMLIRFTTDYAGVTSGWSATYTTAASGGCINETFTAAAGTVTDNSGSSSYLNNMSCEKLIQPSGGGTITLTFTSFITEANYDYVRVYDGSTTSAPLLGTFSGSSLPPVLTSSGGSMLIRFTTDYAGVTSGWSATYTTAASGGCINETFTAAAGTVTDNSGSSSYLNNMSCEKLIQPSGGGTITLTFTSFITEANYDYVRVYDGSTTSAPLLGTFSGSSLPPVLTSSGGSMLIRFTTDYAGVTSGWSATYTTAASGGCINETFTAAAGTVTDNSGSSSYLNNMSCEKLIQPSGGGTITLTFTSFITEANYDYVRVYDGSTTSAPLLGTFSGSSLPPVLTSSGGSMLIRFTTDYAGVTSGWSATYTTAASGGCINETFTAAAGTVTDNSGSSSYLNNMSCEKLIQPSGGGTITLTFTSFITEANYDYVRVYDGSTISAPLLGTFSGSSLPPVLTSSGGSMLIRFTTDYAGVTSGWSATYTSGTDGAKGTEDNTKQEDPPITDLVANPTLNSEILTTDLVAYPNPTSGILTIESSFSEEENYTIDIINLSGQVVLNQKISVIGGKFDIDMSDLNNGFYLIKIITGKTVQFIRVIKN